MRAHCRYLSYVVRHKWFVFVAGLRVSAPLWRLAIHDWSKFLPGEWFPYVASFYTVARVGEHVSGVADGAPFAGVVTKTRPANKTGPGVDCYVTAENGPPFWAWDFEVLTRTNVSAAFNRAWLHHQHHNPHHWQHWVLREDSGATFALDMPVPLIREMVADWMGAGRAITGRWEAGEWYIKNHEKMVLHPDTRRSVEILLLTFAGLDEKWWLARVRS